MWLEATRVRTAPGSTVSRTTGSPGRHRGQRPRCRDAERRHGLADDVFAQNRPEAARPSPRREKGVRPEPLSWMSRRTPLRSTTSPSRMARPSPSWGTNCRTGARHRPWRSARPRPGRACRLRSRSPPDWRAHRDPGAVASQLPVQPDEPRRRDGVGATRREEPIGQAGVGVVEGEMNGHRHSHPADLRSCRTSRKQAPEGTFSSDVSGPSSLLRPVILPARDRPAREFFSHGNQGPDVTNDGSTKREHFIEEQLRGLPRARGAQRAMIERQDVSTLLYPSGSVAKAPTRSQTVGSDPRTFAYRGRDRGDLRHCRGARPSALPPCQDRVADSACRISLCSWCEQLGLPGRS